MSDPAASASQSLAARLAPPAAPADPAAAAERLAELAASSAEIAHLLDRHAGARAVLAAVADGSPFLWQLASSDPARLARLLESEPEAMRERLLAGVRDLVPDEDEPALMKRLRQTRQEMALLVALADLGAVWDVPVVTAALSDFADAAVAAALRNPLEQAARRGRFHPQGEDALAGCGLVALAMGKGGARELNYSSDLDLIVFFDPQTAPLAEGIEPAPFFVRIVQRMVHILQERTGDGYVFRTDLRLRPDPASTAVAISRDAALAYYESVGQNWERAAMLKARPAAGDLALGEDMLRDLAPFVWRKHLDFGAIADVHAMKRQIHVHRGHGEIAVEGHNVKLGRGGIREIEFFVQTQQLVAGGRNPALRVRGTEEALAALTEAGWIDAEARDELTTAYRFLRMVEHRLQMVADAQTHTLPASREELDRFAHFAGFAGRDAFAEALVGHLRRVQGHYARLFEDAASLEASAGGSLVFTGADDDPETLETLSGMGFAEPKMVSALVRGWHHGQVAATRSARARELLTDLLPALLEAVGRTAAPDQALRTLDRVLAGLPAGVEFFALLRSNAGFLGLFADALGTAPRLGQMVARRPHVLDALLEPAFFSRLPGTEELSERLAAFVGESEAYEDLLDRARIFGQEQMVLIGFRVLAGQLGADTAGDAFAALAEVLVARLHRAAAAELERIHGRLPGEGAAVLALGKLGGHEITAASDLDLILIYEHPDGAVSDGPRPLEAGPYYTRLTQRLIAALSAPTAEGRLYDVDMRLRPSGRSGPLATRLAAFAAYQADGAWTWEHMALTRARAISGAVPLREAVAEVIRATLTAPPDAAAVARDVREMRGTLAREKGEDRPWDLKYARGGLVDLEFLAQYLQLVHGHAHPEILHPTTGRVLDAARAAGLLAEGDWEVARAGARLQHDLTQVLRLCVDGPFEPDAAGPGVRALLARAANAPDFASLEALLTETQQAVRAVFERVVV